MTEKPSFFVTRCREAFPSDQMERLKEFFQVSFWSENAPIPRKELKEKLVNKVALYCLLTDKIDNEVLPSGDESKLEVVATMSVGFDHLDVAELKKRNIRIGYTPRVLTNATADFTVSLLLATSRRLLEGSKALKGGD